MRNPWETIALSDYENHMSLAGVGQLQVLNQMMKEQLTSCDADTATVALPPSVGSDTYVSDRLILPRLPAGSLSSEQLTKSRAEIIAVNKYLNFIIIFLS